MNKRVPAHLRFGWVALLICLPLGGVVLFLFDPAQHAIYPFCPLHRFTGIQCAGCGTLRAMHQLGHGNVVQALRLNPLAVLAIPFFFWWLVRQCIANLTGRKLSTTELPQWWIWMVFTVLVAYTVLRNLPMPSVAWLVP